MDSLLSFTVNVIIVISKTVFSPEKAIENGDKEKLVSVNSTLTPSLPSVSKLHNIQSSQCPYMCWPIVLLNKYCHQSGANCRTLENKPFIKSGTKCWD